MRFTIYQESRIGRRTSNEDRLAHCYSRDALLMVVADGMGGHYFGEIAAQIAVQTLTTSFQHEAQPALEDPFLFLRRGMENAHRAIVDFSIDRRLSDMPRTTCVACVVQNNIAYWAHAGDSRLYLFRGGKALLHTRDHSRLQLLLDQGIINEAQAAYHPDRNKVYCSLGGLSSPEIELSRKTPLEAGDILMLCSDGVWNVLSDELMAKTLSNENLMQSVPLLLKQVDNHGGPNADNYSLVAVRWEDSYIDKSTGMSSFVSTRAMDNDTITTKMEKFGLGSGKNELSDEEIERAIEEIRLAIQKYSK